MSTEQQPTTGEGTPYAPEAPVSANGSALPKGFIPYTGDALRRINPQAQVERAYFVTEDDRERIDRWLEKGEKNVTAMRGTEKAATGHTYSADAEVAHVSRLRAMFTQQVRIPLTPIEQEAASAHDASTSSATQGDGINWDKSVPRPRPTVGSLVTFPNGSTSPVRYVAGFLAERSGFDVTTEDETRVVIVRHKPTTQWRVLDNLLDYPDASEDEDAEAPATQAAVETDDGSERTATDLAAPHGGAGETPKAARASKTSQRARNEAQAGIGSAKKKGGSAAKRGTK
jgi:hypothetical protein